MLLTIVVAILAVGVCNAIHYFSLRQLAAWFYDHPPPVRRPMLVISFAIFVIHMFEAVIYALVMWFLTVNGAGELFSIETGTIRTVEGYFYFSLASYTSLGIGDILPEGHLRVISGIEALQGLILIAWSASFSYLMMERFWNVHLDRLASRIPDQAGTSSDRSL